MKPVHSGTWGSLSAAPFIRVLIIDDYALSRIGIRSALAPFKSIAIVGEADNAETGLYMVRQYLPDMVLMDMTLPGMDGVEATQQIKALDPGIKVLMFTLHNEEERIRAAFEAGADGYALKSIDVDQLLTALHEVYQGRLYLDPGIDCLQPGEYSGRVPSEAVSERLWAKHHVL